MRLYNLTLISVTNVKHYATIKSINKCMESLEFDSVKFISDLKPENFSNDIEYIKTNYLTSKDDYSRFILYELHKYINTSHCLIVQHDGYVVNPEKWDSRFMEYDYIGALWPTEKCYLDQQGYQCRVGNGGFSIRSKKLLELPSKLNVKFDIGEWKNEDLNFCIFNRRLFESEGMRYAPLEIASLFSHELYTPENNNIVPFGMHGKSIC